jgi:hypothetical protein
MVFPDIPQPKHLKIPLLSSKKKEAVFSLWNGHNMTFELFFLRTSIPKSEITSDSKKFFFHA